MQRDEAEWNRAAFLNESEPCKDWKVHNTCNLKNVLTYF